MEFLPDDEDLRKRALGTTGLTRPELAVLLAYAKLDLDSEIVKSELPDDRIFRARSHRTISRKAATRYRGEMENHRLRREIISTVLSNRIVNLAGPVFVHRMKEMSGAPASASRARSFWPKARSDCRH